AGAARYRALLDIVAHFRTDRTRNLEVAVKHMTQIAWQNIKHIVVLGLGQTGVSVLRYLSEKQRQAETGHHFTVRVFDSRDNPPGLNEAKDILSDAHILNRQWQLEDTLGADVIITSPGIDLRDEPLTLARDADIPIVGDVELFA